MTKLVEKIQQLRQKLNVNVLFSIPYTSKAALGPLEPKPPRWTIRPKALFRREGKNEVCSPARGISRPRRSSSCNATDSRARYSSALRSVRADLSIGR